MEKDRLVGKTGGGGCHLKRKMRYNDVLKATTSSGYVGAYHLQKDPGGDLVHKHI